MSGGTAQDSQDSPPSHASDGNIAEGSGDVNGENAGRERKWVTVEREVEIAGSRKALRLTRDAALNLLLLCEQKRYKEGSAIVHGYTDEVLGQLREFVGGEVMEFGYWMRDWLSRSGLAEVFEAREGVPFPEEENYWPGVAFDQSGRVNESMNGLSVEGGQSSTRYSMLKLRVNHHLHFDLSVGATNAFMGAVAMTNNYICMGEVTAKWRRMLGNERFARALYVILMYEKAMRWGRLCLTKGDECAKLPRVQFAAG